MTVYDYKAKLYPGGKDDFTLQFKQEAEKIKLIIDEGMEDYDSSVRRPYFRLRGKRVTEEQAFEIIRRTDRFSPWSEEASCDDQIRPGHFRNNWTRKDLYPAPFGWVHPNGIVGIDEIAGRYPELEEFVDDCYILIREFPYLDFVVAVTWWNEVPQYAWDILMNCDIDDEWDEHQYDEYPDFLDNIEIGFWVHDGTIEAMSPERTRVVYSEYDRKYSEKDHRIYSPHYYMDYQPDVISDDFVARCYKAYGFDGIPEWSGWLKKDPLTDLDNSDIITDATDHV